MSECDLRYQFSIRTREGPYICMGAVHGTTLIVVRMGGTQLNDPAAGHHPPLRPSHPLVRCGLRRSSGATALVVNAPSARPNSSALGMACRPIRHGDIGPHPREAPGPHLRRPNTAIILVYAICTVSPVHPIKDPTGLCGRGTALRT